MKLRTKSGFSLIELMIVVGILGVLAALAIPSFGVYTRRAKTAEAYENLRQIFYHASTYYARERFASSLATSASVHCSVPSGDNRVTPNEFKQAGDYSDPSLFALGVAAGRSYYRYELENQDGTARCFVPPGTAPLYAIRARGDLDGDGEQSLFELVTGSNDDNELYHANSFYIQNETE